MHLNILMVLLKLCSVSLTNAVTSMDVKKKFEILVKGLFKSYIGYTCDMSISISYL